MTANIILLDRLLVQYGPEAGPARELLRRSIPPLVDRIWHQNGSGAARTTPFAPMATAEAGFSKIQELSPSNDAQRSLRARAIETSTSLAQSRLLLFAESDNQIPARGTSEPSSA